MRLKTGAFIIFIGLLLIGCATTETAPFDLTSATPPKEAVIAMVNREPITLSQFLAAYEASGGSKHYSEAEFLDEYIKRRLGVQKARRLHLDSHPSVLYAAEVSIFNKYLEEQYKVQGRGESFNAWESAYLTYLKRTGDVWIEPKVTSGGINSLDKSSIIARVNGEGITVSDFKTIYKEHRRKNSDEKLLSDYIDIQLVVSVAKRRGWPGEDKSFIAVAEEEALFNLVNKIEFGTNKTDPKRIKKMYRRERERSDVENYSSSLFF